MRLPVRHPAATALLAASVLLLGSACSGPDGGAGASPSPSPTKGGRAADPSPSAPPAKGSVKVLRTVATGLKSPWGLAELPDGDLLVSSRDDGTVQRVDVQHGRTSEVGRVPGVAPGGEGGLLGIALSPQFATDHEVYAYFTTASDNRVARFLYEPDKRPGDQLGAPNTLLRGIPKGTIHNGGRIAFGPDGMLYASTGETGRSARAQDRSFLGGKILRMTPDGQPAPGNPFGNAPYVYSLGHRNVEGLAWDAKQRLWASEFGQDTWDELNLIRPGGNYGWPDVEGIAHRKGFVDPVAQWHPDQASPSGIALVRGSVWMAALRGERLWRVPLAGTRAAAAPQAFLVHRYGRLRTVLAAGGDRLWLTTSNTDGRGHPVKGDDRILELRVG
ncbi:PQQ-dependent sugar dehydrogenase [Streptomyces sp. NPDC058045]|uniref:PQQ-dependent sugar dehydrogenase n=1 Tax=Streptomyces sp. NPDC058045 TaxID=3346311 RepID=UPI0036E8640B